MEDRKLQFLLDRLEINDLVTRYFCSADERDFDKFRSCFVAGTSVDYSELLPVPADCPVERVSEVIEATMAERFGPTQHFMGNHEVTIDGDTASGVTYCLAIHRLLPPDENAHRLTSALRYLDRFVRTEAGWRIAHRTVTRDIALDLPGRALEPLQTDRG
jgi:hypothetical protein